MPDADARTDATIPAEVARLAGLLRAAGFQVAVQQCLHASRVLANLDALGPMPRDASTLAGYLGPIFCTNREQQERFPELVREWLAPPKASAPPPPPRTVGRKVSQRPGRTVLALAAAFLGVLLATALGWYQLGFHEVAFTINGDGRAMADAEIRFAGRSVRSGPDGTARLKVRRIDLGAAATVTRDGFRKRDQIVATLDPLRVNLDPIKNPAPGPSSNPTIAREEGGLTVIRPRPFGPDMGQLVGILPAPVRSDSRALGVLVLPSALFLAVWWWSRRRADAIFERKLAHQPPNLRELPLPPGMRQAMPSLPVRQLARDLRRRRLTQSAHLDVPRTLAATLRRGGWYTPVFGSYTESEYLVLVDRSSPGDHQARLVDEVLRILKDAGVGYERLYFDGDPLLCRRPTEPGRLALEPTVSLDELAVRFAGHRLLLFTDGGPFFDPYTGQPAACVRILSRWAEKGIVTPNPIEQWGRIEWTIERLGFTVFPLSPKGLRLLGDHFRDQPHTRLSPRKAASAEIPAHETGRTRWTERHPPTPTRVETLCKSLEHALGAEGFRWLAACCIYPELNWRLTQRIGASLVPNDAQRDVILARLVRLIWFRQSYIPDWLRGAILSRLAAGDRDTIRNVVVELLNSGANPAGRPATEKEGDAARVAIPSPADAPARTTPWQWLKRLRGRMKVERNFSKVLARLPTDSPVKDYVFLRFIAGRPVGDLTPTVPERLRRLLFPEGNPWLGPRTSTLMLLAAVATTAILYVLIEPMPKDRAGACIAIDVAGTNDTVAALYRDGTVETWPQLGSAARTGESGRRIGAHVPIRSIALGSGGTLLAIGAQDGRALVYSNGVLAKTIGTAQKRTNNVAITAMAIWMEPPNAFVVTGNDEGNFRSESIFGESSSGFLGWVNTWGAQNIGSNQTVRCIAVGSKNAAAGFESGIGMAYFKDRGPNIVQSAKPPDSGEYVHSRGSAVWSVDISPDEQSIAFGRLDGTILVSCSHASQGKRPPSPGFVLEGHSAAVFSVRFSPDGKFLVSTGLDGQILLWEVGTNSVRDLFRRVSRIVHPTDSGRYYWSAAFTADGRHILAAASDGTIRILEFDPSTAHNEEGVGKGVPNSQQTVPKSVPKN